MAFAGFPRETPAFLEGIAANNNKEWFTAHRALYDATVESARAFVETVGPRLREVAPAIQYEAKIGGSLSRINRDQRFAKDKPLYREEYDLWFRHGDKKGFEQPGFFVRIMPAGVWVAAGMMHILWPTLKRFREAVLDERSGEELERIVAAISAIGPTRSATRGGNRCRRASIRTRPVPSTSSTSPCGAIGSCPRKQRWSPTSPT